MTGKGFKRAFLGALHILVARWLDQGQGEREGRWRCKLDKGFGINFCEVRDESGTSKGLGEIWVYGGEFPVLGPLAVPHS